jgi:hypothetical protein
MTDVVAIFRLPVSGQRVCLRQPTGSEDLLLAEAPEADAALALELTRRLAHPVDGVLDPESLSVADLDVLILRLRQALAGDRILADVTCRAAGCGSRIDISFMLEDYLAHGQPAGRFRLRHWSVAPAERQPGWYALSRRSHSGIPESEPVLFRLPTGADQLAVANRADATEALAQRCIRLDAPPSNIRHAVEAAMEALAPTLSRELEGVCPECGTTMTIYFDARHFCLEELRCWARFVYEDIHILAQTYHWSERAILAMPNSRRASYAELARSHGGA